MSSETLTKVHDTLFKQLDEVRTGLLGVEGSGQHMQPMAHHPDGGRDTLWFVASKQSDLVHAIGSGAKGQFTITGKDRDYWAALSGPIVPSDNSEKLDEIWSAISAAWFDEGRGDPDVCLLKLAPATASVWTTTDSSVKFGVEIARANVSEEHKPQVGQHWVLNF